MYVRGYLQGSENGRVVTIVQTLSTPDAKNLGKIRLLKGNLI
jgi:hypothetical protein